MDPYNSLRENELFIVICIQATAVTIMVGLSYKPTMACSNNPSRWLHTAYEGIKIYKGLGFIQRLRLQDKPIYLSVPT